MKRTLLILMTILFSFGAFSSNGGATTENIEHQKEVLSSFETSELILKKDKCVIKRTTTITIDHGTYTETIVLVEYIPC
ncbi:MAG TPA: hypothetical protein VFM65_10490 [Flavobacteriaceae bacterium]|nr:hypothetical protein [Flavobacteriaceae bacterium]